MAVGQAVEVRELEVGVVLTMERGTASRLVD